MAAQNGDTVRVHYTGKLDDGTTFDSSAGRDPLEFQVGAGQVIPGFDNAVSGMAPGDQRTVTIPATEAYGEHRTEMVLEVSKDQLPPGLDPGIGDQLQLQTADGQPVPVRVTEVSTDGVTLDANHPLAGQDLTFEIKLEAIA